MVIASRAVLEAGTAWKKIIRGDSKSRIKTWTNSSTQMTDMSTNPVRVMLQLEMAPE